LEALPLSAYLNPINWAMWGGPDDTTGLLNELGQAIAGGKLTLGGTAGADLLRPGPPSHLPAPVAAAQPLTLESPGGTMDAESEFYVERDSDRIALSEIQKPGVTITIKAPRQMGKSSLLMRVIREATRVGKRIAFLDFQLFDQSTWGNADTFFHHFCAWLSDKLGHSVPIEKYWGKPWSNIQRCTKFFEESLLPDVKGPLVLAMDEVEGVFDRPFRNDFFGMLRSWHNNRWAGPCWKHLDLVLVTSTEPYQFIKEANQSPFNVGEVIDLADFSSAQVDEVNRRHKSPLTHDQLRQLITLVGGHPYLVRRALYMVASQRVTPETLLRDGPDDGGPFGDHLRRHLFRLQERAELLQGLAEVLRGGTCRDERVVDLLQGAGLIRRDGRSVVPRCKLYQDFFRDRLHV
jgi:hypothetical protein